MAYHWCNRLRFLLKSKYQLVPFPGLHLRPVPANFQCSVPAKRNGFLANFHPASSKWHSRSWLLKIEITFFEMFTFMKQWASEWSWTAELCPSPQHKSIKLNFPLPSSTRLRVYLLKDKYAICIHFNTEYIQGSNNNQNARSRPCRGPTFFIRCYSRLKLVKTDKLTVGHVSSAPKIRHTRNVVDLSKYT